MKKMVALPKKPEKLELREITDGNVIPGQPDCVPQIGNSEELQTKYATDEDKHCDQTSSFALDQVYDTPQEDCHQNIEKRSEPSGKSRICKKTFSKTFLLRCFGLNSTDGIEANLPSNERNFKNKVTPQVEARLVTIRHKLRERTASYKKETLTPVEPVESDSDEEDVPTQNTRSANPPDPHTLNKELHTEVEANSSSPNRLRCCGPVKLSRHQLTIAPQSHLYLFWLSLVTLAYLYNITTIILRTAFNTYYTEQNYHLWLIVDYTSDCIYLIDLIVIKPRVQFIKNGLLQTDFSETKQYYLKSAEFKLDVASLLPLDLFYFLTGVLGTAPMLRLPRYLKLKTAWEFFDRCDQVAKSGYVIRVIRTMIYMLFLIHVETCGYYAVSVYEGLGSNEWVFQGEAEGNAYIRCFYLATKTATSIGNNPRPTNQLEYMFMTVYWLSGVFVFALLIGQIRDIFESANSVKSSYQKAQDSTLQYLQNLNVPKPVQDKVRDWFNYNWEQQKTLNENLLVDVLPTKMKTDLFISVHYETLNKVSLFQDCDRNLLYDLILKLTPVIFLPGDYICREGEVGTEMYIIMHGEVDVVTDDGLILATLIKGKVFGEISLMGLAGGNRRTANVQSKGYSNLFILSKYDFERAMQDYPTAYTLLKKRAQKLLNKNSKEIKTTGKMEKPIDTISHSDRTAAELASAAIQLSARRGSGTKERSSKYSDTQPAWTTSNGIGT